MSMPMRCCHNCMNWDRKTCRPWVAPFPRLGCWTVWVKRGSWAAACTHHSLLPDYCCDITSCSCRLDFHAMMNYTVNWEPSNPFSFKLLCHSNRKKLRIFSIMMTIPLNCDPKETLPPLSSACYSVTRITLTQKWIFLFKTFQNKQSLNDDFLLAKWDPD